MAIEPEKLIFWIPLIGLTVAPIGATQPTGDEGNILEQLRSPTVVGQISGKAEEHAPEFSQKKVRNILSQVSDKPASTTESKQSQTRIFRDEINVSPQKDSIRVSTPIFRLDSSESARTKIEIERIRNKFAPFELIVFGIRAYRVHSESGEIYAYPEATSTSFRDLDLKFHKGMYSGAYADNRTWGKLIDKEVIPLLGDPPGRRCYKAQNSAGKAAAIGERNAIITPDRALPEFAEHNWYIRPVISVLQLEDLEGEHLFRLTVSHQRTLDE